MKEEQQPKAKKKANLKLIALILAVSACAVGAVTMILLATGTITPPRPPAVTADPAVRAANESKTLEDLIDAREFERQLNGGEGAATDYKVDIRGNTNEYTIERTFPKEEAELDKIKEAVDRDAQTIGQKFEEEAPGLAGIGAVTVRMVMKDAATGEAVYTAEYVTKAL